jgi:ABC-type sugar transport system permease subunit
MSKFRLTLERRKALEGYLFVAPWLIGFLIFLLGPLVQSLRLSFSEVTDINGLQTNFIGFANYTEAFLVDERFVPTLLKVFRNSIMDVPIIMVFALFIAILVNQKMRGQTLFRALFFLPVVIGSGLVIQRLFEQGVGNIQNLSSGAGTMQKPALDINALLYTYLGPGPSQPIIEVLNRLLFVLWRSGVQILMFLAGLQGISAHLYEAARMDGATDWEIFWKVTLPMVSPILLVTGIYTVVDSFTDVFNDVLFFIRDIAFRGQFRFGYAAALGWVYFLMIFLIILLVVLITKRYVHYEGER